MPDHPVPGHGRDRMRRGLVRPTLEGMDNEREYDQDTVGDYDENTLDGSEGLDADAISTDGEDRTVEPPEDWKPLEEDENLDERLRAERPDVDESAGPTPPVDPVTPEAERRDSVDELDPEGESRVLGDD